MKIKLQIFDPQQSSEKCAYKNEYMSNLKNADGIILVYDISYNYSLKELIFHNKNIEKKLSNKNKVIKILAGNKCDKENDRCETIKDGQNFAIDYNYIFYKTSAKNNINVDEIFNLITKKILKEKENKSKRKRKIPKLIIRENDVEEKNEKKKCLII